MKIFFILLTFIILGFGIVYKMNYAPTENNYDILQANYGGDFTLDSKAGKISLSDFKGKVTILYFGFATCPDVCPMSLSYLSKALKKVEGSEDVQVIFISVDYKRDTPSKADNYAKFFNKQFIGATGTKEEIDQVVSQYNVYYKFIEMPDSAIEYTVDHTSRFFIINRDGKARKMIRSDEDQEIFIKELTAVIKNN
tara:strand:- start:173743 stop:174330 length:588 start_codon:yes stop_codon:yes gene_type:complete